MILLSLVLSLKSYASPNGLASVTGDNHKLLTCQGGCASVASGVILWLNLLTLLKKSH